MKGRHSITTKADTVQTSSKVSMLLGVTDDFYPPQQYGTTKFLIFSKSSLSPSLAEVRLISKCTSFSIVLSTVVECFLTRVRYKKWKIYLFIWTLKVNNMCQMLGTFHRIVGDNQLNSSSRRMTFTRLALYWIRHLVCWFWMLQDAIVSFFHLMSIWGLFENSRSFGLHKRLTILFRVKQMTLSDSMRTQVC